MAEQIRLNKYISDSGICSRREADKFIENGSVRINGRKVETASSVNPYSDKVTVNGIVIEPKKQEELILMAFNKPVGVTSTTENGVKDSVVDFINYHERIFPIGRLDKDSHGLLFMTNNGDIVNKILRAGNNHEKEYIVTVDKAITDEFIHGMSSGVPILGTITKKCKISQISNNVFNIILVQGMNRQIRRMSEYFGYNVVKLERIRIMNIHLKGIATGDWRLIEGEELRELHSLIADSNSEAEPNKENNKTSVSNNSSAGANNKSDVKNKKTDAMYAQVLAASAKRGAPARGQKKR